MDPALYTASTASTPPSPPPESASSTALRSARGDHAYLELKRRLLLGEFPLRDRLAEERLATLLQVSRTPVRQALLRLHTEQLVERHPDGGFFPAAPDLHGIRELYEVRRALELAALHRPGERGTRHDAAVLESLRDDWRALRTEPPEPDPEFVLSDEMFHVQLAEAAGNAALADMLRVVNERIRLVRMHDFLTEERVRRTIDQHLGIAEAVLAGRLDLALRNFESHLGESIAVVEDRASRALARMVTRERTVET